MAEIYSDRKGCPWLREVPWIPWSPSHRFWIYTSGNKPKKNHTYPSKSHQNSPLLRMAFKTCQCMLQTPKWNVWPVVDKNPNLAYCYAFKAKSLPDKRNFVLEHGLCFNCLKVNALHPTVVSNAANDITPSFTRMIPVILSLKTHWRRQNRMLGYWNSEKVCVKNWCKTVEWDTN